MKKQKIFIPVDTNEWMPKKAGFYGIIVNSAIEANPIFATAWFNEYNFTASHPVSFWLEEKPDMYVFDEQQLKELIGNTFNAGEGRAAFMRDRNAPPQLYLPNKTEYINNLIK